MSPPEALDHLIREPAGVADGALVLLHGRGVDERDLHPLLDELDPERRLLGVTPGGPITDQPPGGRHWYVIQQVGQPEPTSFVHTLERLCRFLDGLLEERGIAWDRTIVGGFSQGAVTACAVALRAERPRPAGLLMMSGFYPDVPGWPLQPGGRTGMPAYVAHGAFDPIIPVDFGRAAAELLREGGLDLTYRETPVPHTVDGSLLGEMRDWLAAAIPAGASEPAD